MADSEKDLVNENIVDPNETPAQKRLRLLLEKKEQKRKETEKIEVQIKEIKKKAAQDERKKQTQQKIEIGGLAVIANIFNLDKAVLMGAFMEIAEKILKEDIEDVDGKMQEVTIVDKENPVYIKWLEKGSEILKKRQDQRRARANSQGDE